jgi:hypothetical protein
MSVRTIDLTVPKSVVNTYGFTCQLSLCMSKAYSRRYLAQNVDEQQLFNIKEAI